MRKVRTTDTGKIGMRDAVIPIIELFNILRDVDGHTVFRGEIDVTNEGYDKVNSEDTNYTATLYYRFITPLGTRGVMRSLRLDRYAHVTLGPCIVTADRNAVTTSDPNPTTPTDDCCTSHDCSTTNDDEGNDNDNDNYLDDDPTKTTYRQLMDNLNNHIARLQNSSLKLTTPPTVEYPRDVPMAHIYTLRELLKDKYSYAASELGDTSVELDDILQDITDHLITPYTPNVFASHGA